MRYVLPSRLTSTVPLNARYLARVPRWAAARSKYGWLYCVIVMARFSGSAVTVESRQSRPWRKNDFWPMLRMVGRTTPGLPPAAARSAVAAGLPAANPPPCLAGLGLRCYRMDPKTFKNLWKICKKSFQNRSRRPSGRGLGAIWAPRGPPGSPKAQKARKSEPEDPPPGTKLETQIVKKSFRSGPRAEKKRFFCQNDATWLQTAQQHNLK